eukprot:3800163-Prymnesium_polylepis.1
MAIREKFCRSDLRRPPLGYVPLNHAGPRQARTRTPHARRPRPRHEMSTGGSAESTGSLGMSRSPIFERARLAPATFTGGAPNERKQAQALSVTSWAP